MCLRGKEFEALEDAWIELLARVGAKQVMPFKNTWVHCARSVWQNIEGEQLHVSDALQMTAKLFILCHRQTSEGKTTHVARLRKEIIDFFPEGATLTHRGMQQMGRIMPNEGAPTYPFVQRVLSGMGHMIDKGDTLHMHRALEYISRKKLQIPLPHVWPAPTTEIADKGEPLWFLWGAMLLFFPENEHVQLLWHLYAHQWRASVKSSRLGILWGIAHLIQDGVHYTWTKEELGVLEKVYRMAPELWASIQEVEGPIDGDDEYVDPFPSTPLGNLDVLHSFVPRGAEPKERHEPSITNDASSLPPRVIRLKSSKPDRPNDLGIKPYKVNKVGDNRVSFENASNCSDPRYRWLDFGTKGA
jgi:hypothetical protein